MSNIFYSSVDANLQEELNARGQSGRNRTTADLRFMLEKVANVELTAYESSSISSNQIGRLGGDSVLGGRYLPTGPDGFLNESRNYTTQRIELDKPTGKYIDVTDNNIDSSRKIGPYITSVDVTIGDHTMGLLNKATVNISVPNPLRDLDTIEDIWLRPGRYMSIKIKHPDSAIVSFPTTTGLLTPNSLPDKEKLQERYPGWKIDDMLMAKLSQMNEFLFEGLITNFEFSYQASGQVDITLSITGTGNTYTDIQLFMPNSSDKEKKTEKPSVDNNPTFDPKITTPTVDPKTQLATDLNNPQSVVGKSSFYQLLYDRVDTLIKAETKTSTPKNTGFIKFTTEKSKTSNNITDQYIVFGEPYNPTYNPGSPINTTNFSRYITLGALVQFINDYPIENITGSAPAASVKCDDIQCKSNYYSFLVSSTPNDVLLLPQDTNKPNDMNWYGDEGTGVIYYKNLSAGSNMLSMEQWPGIYGVLPSTNIDVIYPSRILLNLEMIQDILYGSADGLGGSGGLTNNGSTGFTLKSFFAVLSSKISYATGKAIVMQLITHPSDPTILLYADRKFLKAKITTSVDPVIPYSVPMFANHPYGTIVRDFKLSATIPDSVKTLSYVLNQSDDVSKEDIAPYINYMYNAKNAESANRLVTEYSDRHKKAIASILESRAKFGQSPMVPELEVALFQALTTYLKYPTDSILKTQQLTAPIFPFSAEFTIDGINGFRYGDVLTFEALPLKYRNNTVFSIISITHTVGSDGQWTTNVRCIMRPNIS
jgi:hypothetical protein